jgi:hypothetical protein
MSSDKDNDPHTNYSTTVAIGSDIYDVSPGSQFTNLSHKNRNDFLQTFHTYPDNTELLLRKYLYPGQKIESISFRPSQDKKDLINILKRRLQQLKDSLDSSTTVKHISIQRNYLDLQNILYLIENPESQTKPIEIPTLTDNEIFHIILEISWYLKHPDDVPNDIEAEWSELLKEFKKIRVIDVVDKIKNLSKQNSSIQVKNNPLNYFEKINLKKVINEKTTTSAQKKTIEMISTPPPPPPSSASESTLSTRISDLLRILRLKEIIDDKNASNSSFLNNSTKTQHLSDRIIKQPFPPQSPPPQSSTPQSSTPQSSPSKKRPKPIVKSFSSESSDPSESSESSTSASSPATAVVSPTSTSDTSTSTSSSSVSTTKPSVANVATSTTSTSGGATPPPKKKKEKKTTAVEQKEEKEETSTEFISPLSVLFKNAILSLYAEFEQIYNPVYEFIENTINTITKEGIDMRSLLVLLHICNQLRDCNSSNNKDCNLGVYHIKNAPQELVTFIKSFLNQTESYLNTLQLNEQSNFKKNIQILPKVRVTSLIKKNGSVTMPTNVKEIPCLNFFIMNTNISIPKQNELTPEQKKIDSKMYDDLLPNKLFKDNDLYIILNKDSGLFGLNILNELKNIPLNFKEIDYLTVNIKEKGIKINPLSNDFDKFMKDHNDSFKDLYLDKLITFKDNSLMNDGELGLSTFITLKDSLTH